MNLQSVIYDRLISQPSIETQECVGLFDGAVGKAIIFHLMYRHTGIEEMKTKAFQMLNEVAEKIMEVESLHFDNGLIGIGWAIEWLSQNDFIKENTDIILEDLDVEVYKSVLYKKEEDVSLEKGTLGKAAYFVKRSASVNKDTHRYLRLAHDECLLHLTDDLADLLNGADGILTKGVPEDMLNAIGFFDQLNHLASYLLLFANFRRVNGIVIENTLYDIVSFIDLVLSRICTYELNKLKHSHYTIINSISYAALCYLRAGKIRKYQFWQERAEEFLIKCNICSSVSPLDQKEQFLKLNLLTLQNLIIPSAKLAADITAILKQIIDNHDLKFQLRNGWGAIIVSWLSITNPSINKNLLDLIFFKHRSE